jgi:hypothetical protein
LLGKHRLMCGDAQEAADVKRLMNGASASAVFCDPPYNPPARSIGSRGQVKHSDFAFASGEMSAARFKKFLAQTLGNGVLVSAEGAVHFVCMDWRHIAELVDVGRDLYGALFCKSPQLVGLSAMYASAISGCRNAWLEREDSNSRIPDRTRSLRAIRDIWEYCRAKSEA